MGLDRLTEIQKERRKRGKETVSCHEEAPFYSQIVAWKTASSQATNCGLIIFSLPATRDVAARDKIHLIAKFNTSHIVPLNDLIKLASPPKPFFLN